MNLRKESNLEEMGVITCERENYVYKVKWYPTAQH